MVAAAQKYLKQDRLRGDLAQCAKTAEMLDEGGLRPLMDHSPHRSAAGSHMPTSWPYSTPSKGQSRSFGKTGERKTGG